jgi:hypothetical protein
VNILRPHYVPIQILTLSIFWEHPFVSMVVSATPTISSVIVPVHHIGLAFGASFPPIPSTKIIRRFVVVMTMMAGLFVNMGVVAKMTVAIVIWLLRVDCDTMDPTVNIRPRSIATILKNHRHCLRLTFVSMVALVKTEIHVHV